MTVLWVRGATEATETRRVNLTRTKLLTARVMRMGTRSKGVTRGRAPCFPSAKKVSQGSCIISLSHLTSICALRLHLLGYILVLSFSSPIPFALVVSSKLNTCSTFEVHTIVQHCQVNYHDSTLFRPLSNDQRLLSSFRFHFWNHECSANHLELGIGQIARLGCVVGDVA